MADPKMQEDRWVQHALVCRRCAAALREGSIDLCDHGLSLLPRRASTKKVPSATDRRGKENP